VIHEHGQPCGFNHSNWITEQNAFDIMGTFWDLNCCCQCSFPQTLESIMEPNGVGSKIGLLVLYFAFHINDGVPVDSHVQYVAHAGFGS